MAQNQDLFGKTFDQQLVATEGQITDCDISPNRRIPGEIVFEPVLSGIRVTARDAQHRVLWGYVASRETVGQIHCLVAMYESLQNLIGEELQKRGRYSGEGKDPMTAAQYALDNLEKTIKSLRESLNVKKISDATLERARTVARIVSDSDRQIALEINMLKGVKSKTQE